MAETKLDLSCRISTPKGWMELQSPSGYPYKLASTSFAEQSRTQRRTTVSNPFVEGSFTVNAVPENVEETLSVWVSGDSYYEMESFKDVLIQALEQVKFLMEFRVEDVVKTWYCYAADVSVDSRLEFFHNRLTQVTATIPRLPAEDRSMT